MKQDEDASAGKNLALVAGLVKLICTVSILCRDEILTAVSQHQVVLIAGETGCGKTTQVRACPWRIA